MQINQWDRLVMAQRRRLHIEETKKLMSFYANEYIFHQQNQQFRSFRAQSGIFGAIFFSRLSSFLPLMDDWLQKMRGASIWHR